LTTLTRLSSAAGQGSEWPPSTVTGGTMTPAATAAHGLAGDRARLLVRAAGEVCTYLKYLDQGNAAVRTWEQAGALMCAFSQPDTSISDPFLGLRSAGWTPRLATDSG